MAAVSVPEPPSVPLVIVNDPVVSEKLDRSNTPPLTVRAAVSASRFELPSVSEPALTATLGEASDPLSVAVPTPVFVSPPVPETTPRVVLPLPVTVRP